MSERTDRKTIKLAVTAPGQLGVQFILLEGQISGYRINDKDAPDCATFYADNRTVIVPLANLVSAELNFMPSEKR